MARDISYMYMSLVTRDISYMTLVAATFPI